MTTVIILWEFILGSQAVQPNSSCTAVYKLDVINIINSCEGKAWIGVPLWSLTIGSLRIIHSTFGQNFCISLRGNMVPLSFPVCKKHIMFISHLISVNNITYLSLSFSFICTPSFYAFPCPLRDALIHCREGHCVVAQGEVNRFNGLITILKPPPLTCFKIAVWFSLSLSHSLALLLFLFRDL